MGACAPTACVGVELSMMSFSRQGRWGSSRRQEALMRAGTGSRKQNLFMPIPETAKEEQYSIPPCRYMTPRIETERYSIGYRHLAQTANRKPGSGKEREQNISGRKSIYLPTTGTTGRMQRSGVLPGQNTATNTLNRRNKLITGHI